MLALQVVGGRPQFLYEGPLGRIKVEVESRVDDGEWHALHLRLHAEVTLGLSRGRGRGGGVMDVYVYLCVLVWMCACTYISGLFVLF